MEAIMTSASRHDVFTGDRQPVWRRVSENDDPHQGLVSFLSAVGRVWTDTGHSSFVIDHSAVDWLIFRRLHEEWRAERGATSSITNAAMCGAYQRIIAMGQRAVPLILRQLQSEGDEPDQWFWALSVITGANPIADADRGNFPRMAHAWLQWGRDRGFLSAD